MGSVILIVVTVIFSGLALYFLTRAGVTVYKSLCPRPRDIDVTVRGRLDDLFEDAPDNSGYKVLRAPDKDTLDLLDVDRLGLYLYPDGRIELLVQDKRLRPVGIVLSSDEARDLSRALDRGAFKADSAQSLSSSGDS